MMRLGQIQILKKCRKGILGTSLVFLTGSSLADPPNQSTGAYVKPVVGTDGPTPLPDTPTETLPKEDPMASSPGSVAAGDSEETEQQKRAKDLFREGNALVRESLFIQAVSKYEEALSLWDHPGIHYNLALSLLNLEKPLRMRAHLLAAVAAGKERLGDDKFQRAQEYLKLVEKQLSTFDIAVTEKDAEVRLDGSRLFIAPGSAQLVLEPGRHNIQIKKAGYEPRDEEVRLIPGESLKKTYRLYRPEEYVRYERAAPSELPWLTLLGGLAVTGAGATFFALGSSNVSAYDQEVRNECGIVGCSAGVIDSAPGDYVTWQHLGVGGMVAGGIAALTGLTWIVLNQPVARRVDPETGRPLQVLPTAGPSAVGINMRGTF